jgi:hypothetical protein
MNYTIQQIEELNFDEFKDNPEDLITLAKQLLNIKKYEKAITMLEKAIHIARDKYNNEDSIECAKFYYHYADAIIRKLSEGDELFGINGETTEAPTKEDNEDNIKIENINENVTNGHNNYNNIEPLKTEDDVDEEDEEPEQSEVITDEQYAFENLAFAEKIYKTYLSQYDNTPPEELSNEVKSYLDYADIFHKYGELEMCKSSFKTAAEFFQKALDIRKKYQSKFSRAIAELYWNMATVYDFDSQKCLLCYYKTKVILEYHLKEELKNNNLPQADKITINEDDLELDSIEFDKIVYFKDVLESLDENISEDIAELVELINIIFTKVFFI